MAKKGSSVINKFVSAEIKIKLISKEAKLPTYAHSGDAGFDIYSTESGAIKPGSIKIFSTGIASEFSEKWFVLFRDRSGLAAKYGIHILAGVLDSGYRGEWKVVLVNLGKKNYKVEKGERIAQGILLPIVRAKIKKAKNLSETKRGSGKFGSTGKK